MEGLVPQGDEYRTGPGGISLCARALPSLSFYRTMAAIVFRASSLAKRSRYKTKEWAHSSLDIARALESVGVKISVTGVDHFRNLEGPCVFIANHMSTLETFVLPAIIAPIKDVTFVVKQSLVDYPVFRHVMRSRDPVTVGRTNPRDDLRAVLEGGAGRLGAGRSMIIFPQTTRALDFDPGMFNTIGIKLAKKAGAPVVPIALKTDAWGNGKHLKDFGRIDPSKKVHFAFGEPLLIKDRGTEEHARIIEFIARKLEEWNG
ncbi:MAG: 1-acyl-sn-glycerol-3-phosphate acyltransferase [Nitrospirae bacterium]|nr:1-acyl-sn-glycerol-3-phosphate acyltransferase [Nitrospirota bacterium]MCL5238421.1 1-acyl-sn-glycerol-3-phosphate acyltransferase [Nitrospirota bacterium]